MVTVADILREVEEWPGGGVGIRRVPVNTHMYSLQIIWPCNAAKVLTEIRSEWCSILYNGLELGLHRKIGLIESNVKWHYQKN
jgi:hypothetical protein